MQFALGLGHVVTWSLVGFASPYLLGESTSNAPNLEETSIVQSPPSSSTYEKEVGQLGLSPAVRMMVLSSSVLSIAGVSFIAFSYYRAGSQVKELFYNANTRSMIVRNHRPFGSVVTNVEVAKLRLQETSHLGANSPTLRLISDDGASFALSMDGMFLNRLYLFNLLKKS